MITETAIMCPTCEQHEQVVNLNDFVLDNIYISDSEYFDLVGPLYKIPSLNKMGGEFMYRDYLAEGFWMVVSAILSSLTVVFGLGGLVAIIFVGDGEKNIAWQSLLVSLFCLFLGFLFFREYLKNSQLFRKSKYGIKKYKLYMTSIAHTRYSHLLICKNCKNVFNINPIPSEDRQLNYKNVNEYLWDPRDRIEQLPVLITKQKHSNI